MDGDAMDTITQGTGEDRIAIAGQDLQAGEEGLRPLLCRLTPHFAEFYRERRPPGSRLDLWGERGDRGRYTSMA